MTTIGARELRDRLGATLHAVSEGETITITRWGKPVARLVPIPKSGLPEELEARMWRLVAEGAIQWNGGPVVLPDPVAVNRSGTLLSDLAKE